jgi:hypothetical protein
MAMTAEPHVYESAPADAPLEYRALSAGAVTSLVLGLASAFILPAALTSVQGALMLAPIPLVGLVFGVRALLKIRALPDQFTGGRLALTGGVLSAAFLVGGLGLAGYVYATEVPDGYSRVSFVEMKPDQFEAAQGVIVPPDVMRLEGGKVFIKGYMRPPSQMYGLDNFLLVRDNQACCFGDNLPAYFDRMRVQLPPTMRANYSTRMYRVGGVLKIDPSAAAGADRPVFTLMADYLK